VEVSALALAQSLSRLNQEPPVRQELIDRVRAEIETGNYETPERIDGAIDNILRELSA
jgi:anti-sigma28 factor (negative regulator of flagellin synthesis)